MTGTVMREMEKRENTGLVTQLKGHAEHGQHKERLLQDQQVHYKRDFPARLDAFAYMRRDQAETVPEQERHLPRELGHAVQRKLGAVRANAIHSDKVVQRFAIYRGMADDGTGRPALGQSATTLGARPNFDIPLYNGMVYPNDGGMSAMNNPRAIPQRLRNNPIWHMDTVNLPQQLVYVPDSGAHGTVQPNQPMQFNVYQQSIHGTQAQWTQ